MTTPSTRPVLIVGAGPTGMTAAIELDRLGVPLRLVEKAAEPATTSRALGVQARTLELFDQRGLAAAMLAAGHKVRAVSVRGGAKRLFRIDLSRIDSRYPYILILSQAETERILREQLARQGVTIERGVECIAAEQTDPRTPPRPGDRVLATLRHRDGSLEEVEASYLIDAEGAHSQIRSVLGLHFEGKSLPEGYALGDLILDGDLPNDEMSIFSAKSGFMALFPFGERRFRLIVSNPLTGPEGGTGPSLTELQAIFDQRSEIPAQLRDLTWSSWFRINSRMISTLRQGRIFFGGDSAHIHSPAGGQGMNTGIQDMINLAWKLALVLGGKAAPALLDTYSADRVPVIRDVLARTEKLTAAISSENPLFRWAFNQVTPWAVPTDFVQTRATATISQVALNYRTSSLSANDAHLGHLRAGDRLPDMQINTPPEIPPTPQRIYERLDPDRFTLLVTGSAGPAQENLAPWADFLRILEIAPAAATEARDRFVATFGNRPAMILVRPDSYVGFLGDQTSLPLLVNYLQQWYPTNPGA